MGLKNTETHYQNLEAKLYTGAGVPVDPQTGDMWYNTTTDNLNMYNGTAWKTVDFSTTTSTSTTTTSTSSSTTTTSTSSSTTTTVSTSTSSSTTTTI